MNEDSKKYLKVVESIQPSIDTLKEIKCSCNEYVEHTCDRCVLINKFNALAMDASEALYRSFKERGEE